MEILVCVKRVPDTAENEIEVNGDGSDIERDDLVYSVNEWDNYAVEEAIQIRDNVGGSVTVVTVGDVHDPLIEAIKERLPQVVIGDGTDDVDEGPRRNSSNRVGRTVTRHVFGALLVTAILISTITLMVVLTNTPVAGPNVIGLLLLVVLTSRVVL